MTTDIDLSLLSSQYGRQFTSAELVVDGVNRTYRVREDEQNFYLRLYRKRGRSAEEIGFELGLLQRFPILPDVDVARPVSSADGTYLIALNHQGEQRRACLFEEAVGREMTTSHDDLALFGEALAKLHCAALTIPGGSARPLRPVKIWRDAIDSLRPRRTFETLIPKIDRTWRSALDGTTISGLPEGNCHGDAWLGNARATDRKVIFFDFDECGHGPLMLDLGTQAWHLHHDGSADIDGCVSALLDGYEKVRPLSDAERGSLSLFVALAELRSLLFLSRFCVLSNELWEDVSHRALGPLSLT